MIHTFISNTLKWKTNTDHITKKAHQRLFFLRQLKKFKVKQSLLLQFYTAIIESILTSSVTVWYSSLDSQSRKQLQRIVKKASKIIGKPLLSVESLYIKHTIKTANKIISAPSHPAHHLFHLMPHRRRYRSLFTKTSCFKHSFFSAAIRTLNTLQ